MVETVGFSNTPHQRGSVSMGASLETPWTARRITRIKNQENGRRVGRKSWIEATMTITIMDAVYTLTILKREYPTSCINSFVCKSLQPGVKKNQHFVIQIL
ncbi:hypothetical protein AKO1_003616 [Acrasis kona]|uniref:Uncharacterized protein n=1 Tax=Acrasis kona TaxID=1008807 RepID=A0AAW2Z6F9_9EUKA